MIPHSGRLFENPRIASAQSFRPNVMWKLVNFAKIVGQPIFFQDLLCLLHGKWLAQMAFQTVILSI